MASLVQPRVSKYRAAILDTLTEPRTPNEIAESIGANQKTVQNDLLELALDGRVKHKKVGRVHIFWKA